jgi:hypothetical protein
VEERKEYEGKGYMARTIRNFNKDIGEGSKRYENSQSQEKPASGQNIEPQRESREAFGQRLAIHGMVNGMLASGVKPREVIGQLGDLLVLEDAIDNALKNPGDVYPDQRKICLLSIKMKQQIWTCHHARKNASPLGNGRVLL